MKQWYKITAKKDSAEIFIYEQIGADFFGDGVAAKPFVSDLNKLNVKTIDLYINSPGGNVFDGNSIYNALRRHPSKIDVYIDGVAASIASVIAMAGDRIIMPENTLMMIHDPSAGVWGTAADMQKMIEALDRIKIGSVAAYKTHVPMEEKAISDLMAAETWMTAAEAVEKGFATEMIEPVKMAANFDAFKLFNNLPESLTNKKITVKTDGIEPDVEKIAYYTINDFQKNLTQEEDMPDITFDLIQNEHPEIVSEILSGVDADYIRENLPDVVAQMKTDYFTDGADTERRRIQAVRDQSMPGHEKLIDELMFDGSTTGEQAAVKILQAEKKMREQMKTDLADDAPDAIEQPPTDNVDTVNDEHLPIDKRCEARWEKDKELQKEFMGDFDGYLAYEKALDAGKVKVLNK